VRDGRLVRWQGIHGPCPSPRSRWAVGVGDVGGERGGRAPGVRGAQPWRP
jgi:hypothetical protein